MNFFCRNYIPLESFSIFKFRILLICFQCIAFILRFFEFPCFPCVDVKSVALQLRRAKTDWSGCCQMTVQGALWLAKRLSLTLNFSFLNRIHYFSCQVATQLSSRGSVDPVPEPILPEKFLGYSRESNPGPLGWQSDVLTTIPNRYKKSIFCNMLPALAQMVACLLWFSRSGVRSPAG